tara:strand:+ start:314 stop:757 length:444 start_codon:yes stop_codon:yes gene_type:complete
MAKISTYTITTPTANDIIIGTDVLNTNITKNFTALSVANLSAAYTLQNVLTQGNVATSNMTLTGNLSIVGSILSPLLTGPVVVDGTLRVNSAGTQPADGTAVDPSTQPTIPIVGSGKNSSRYLSEPDAWLKVNIGGTEYVFAGYIPG